MDLGLELLMNPKKKVQSDNGSIASGDIGSVKSIKLTRAGDVSRSDVSRGDLSNDASELSDDVSRITSDEDDGSFIERVRVQDIGEDEVASEVSYRSSTKYGKRRPHTPAYTSSVEDSDVESLGSMLARGERPQQARQTRMSDEEIVQAKREILYQFDRMEKRGMKLPRKFTLASNLEEMKLEYERLKRDKELDNAIKYQRKGLTMFTSGVEFLNSKFDPLSVKLDGWSESVHENIEEYDDIFEELYEKYKGKAKMAPELKLLFALGGSAFMFHMTQSMFKAFPGAEQVFKQNPDLARQFAAATANTMKQQQPQGSIFSGLSGMFSNMFGGGNTASVPTSDAPPPPSTQQQKFNMRGPSNVDDIMRELEKNDNDRIEVMSTVTSSEFTELQDDVSISNLVYRKKGSKKPQGRSVTLDL